jgi:hypothetical protein
MRATHRTSTESVILGFLLALGLPAVIVLSLPAAGRLAISPDSISYLTVAGQIAAGKGLSMPTFALFGNATGSFTTWPPLFPLVLASGISPIWIQAAALGSLGAVVFLLFATSLRVNAVVSLLLAWACALSMPLLVDATYVWSEVLALAMTALMLWTFAGIGSSGTWWRWALGVVFCGLAIYARYAMALLVPGLMLALLLAPLDRLAQRLQLALLTPVAVGAMFAPLLWHNLARSHQLTGAARAVAHRGLLANLSDAVLGTASAFASTPLWKAVFVLALVAVLVVAGGALLARLRATGDRFADAPADPAVWVARLTLVLALVYAAGMVALRTLVHFDRLDTRLMSPAVFLLGMSLCTSLVAHARSPRHSALERAVLALPFAVLMALSLHQAAAQGDLAWHAWRERGSPAWPMNSLFVYNNIQAVDAPRVDGLVLCDRPMMVQFLTAWQARQIPPGPWTDAGLRHIASAARALLVNDRESFELAARLRALLPQATMRQVAGGQLLQWTPPTR